MKNNKKTKSVYVESNAIFQAEFCNENLKKCYEFICHNIMELNNLITD